jgi:hypothetical protein
LTWSFEQQLEKGNCLEFRATVSFVLGDVPHHFCGGWQTSKKKAQRDGAERVTSYFEKQKEALSAPSSQAVPCHAAVEPEFLPEDVFKEMQAMLKGEPSCEGESQLEWKSEERMASESKEFRFVVTFYIHEVPHHFAGGWCSADSLDAAASAAKRDAVERVLWYFGHSEENFAASAADRSEISSAPPLVSGDAVASPEKQPQLEDKTILMQVQNTLQKQFAKDTPPGAQVWKWTYDADQTDPQLFRAHVEIPAWGPGGRHFMGEWCKGKKTGTAERLLKSER